MIGIYLNFRHPLESPNLILLEFSQAIPTQGSPLPLMLDEVGNLHEPQEGEYKTSPPNRGHA